VTGEPGPADAGAVPAGPSSPSPPPARADELGDHPVHLDQIASEFSAFYKDFMPRLVRFLILDGAPPALAAELAQEVMVALWRTWDTVQSPKAWARTAASRAWIRYRTHLPELPAEIPESLLISSQEAADIETRHDLLRLLRLLTPRERQVAARTYDGDTPAEIAAELQITEATVRSLQRNARRTMAKHRDARREGADR
jgi:RNA polymerase sigma-70 factor (ECF subfamily)